MTTQASSDPAPRSFTDTPQFKVMKVLMSVATPLVKRRLARGDGGRLSRNLVLLRFRGRKSGTWFTTPVGYAREGDTVVIITSPTYRWWRNVAGGARVQLRLDGRWRDGEARIVGPEDPAYDETVALQVRRRGAGMLKGFGVELDADGRVPASARSQAAERVHLVRVELDPARATASVPASGRA
jgi:deazaflavin-dependent oxidoreductase (nitroreductase family)